MPLSFVNLNHKHHDSTVARNDQDILRPALGTKHLYIILKLYKWFAKEYYSPFLRVEETDSEKLNDLHKVTEPGGVRAGIWIRDWLLLYPQFLYLAFKSLRFRLQTPIAPFSFAMNTKTSDYSNHTKALRYQLCGNQNLKYNTIHNNAK